MQNYAINYFFYLYLMLHVYIQTLDVTGTAQKILRTKQRLGRWSRGAAPDTLPNSV
jgi:hypothetical protein